MRFILYSIIVILISFNQARAFSKAPRIQSVSSSIKASQEVSALEKLWALPTLEVKAETIKSYKRGNVKVEEIYYQSRTYKDRPVKIFGYFCYPLEAKEKLPAILLSHGGGGSAHLGRSLNWAERGYAVLTIDLPGKGEKRAASRSSGPDLDVPILLRTKPDPSYNYLVHAVAASRNGITYLTQRKEVDAKRIGMVGLSWGGVLTLLTNGQDQRLKTAVNVFGAGYLPEGCTWQTYFEVMSEEELNTWNALIDPKNFLKSQNAPVLFITGTNDHCYYLPTFQKSYQEVAAPKNLLLVPNLRHQFLEDTQRIVWRWLDDQLKYCGSFPVVTLLPAYMKGNKKMILPVKVATHWNRKPKKVILYYTQGQPNRFTRRKWLSLNAFHENGIYFFGIPDALITPEIMFYVNAEDSQGAIASTLIRSVFRVQLEEGEEMFALSSPIDKVNIHARPFQFMGRKVPEDSMVFYSKQDKVYQLVLPKQSSLPQTLYLNGRKSR